MNKQVQHTGIRKWFGDDWIKMQDELFKAIETGLLKTGTGIVSGVERTGTTGAYTFSDGIVIIDGHLHTFEAHTSPNATIYIIPATSSINRDYLQGGSQEIAVDYTTTVVYTPPSSGTFIKADSSTKDRYFILKTDGNNKFEVGFEDVVNVFVADKFKLSEPDAGWVAIPGASYANPHPLGMPKYYVDNSGYYHFKGYWNCDEVAYPPLPEDSFPVWTLNIPTNGSGPYGISVKCVNIDGTITERYIFSTKKVTHMNELKFGFDLAQIQPLKSF